MELLFSYGTLQQDNVQLASFGRLLKGERDILPGYTISEIEIFDENVVKASGKKFHPILKETQKDNDEVLGTVFVITPEELAQADAYEVDAYTRILAKLKSGKNAWIYAAV